MDAPGVTRVERINYLKIVISSDFLELGKVSGKFGQLDVHRGANGGAEVARAEGQVTEPVALGEFDLTLHLLEYLEQSTVHLLQVASLLHRYQTQVVLLVHPRQCCLCLVEKYSSAYMCLFHFSSISQINLITNPFLL